MQVVNSGLTFKSVGIRVQNRQSGFLSSHANKVHNLLL